MDKSKAGVLLVLVLIVGCATLTEIGLAKSFDRTSEAYGNAMRWSDFETANNFVKASQKGNNLLDFKEFNHIKIISYYRPYGLLIRCPLM